MNGVFKFVPIPAGTADLAITGLGFTPKQVMGLMQYGSAGQGAIVRGGALKATPIVDGYSRFRVDDGDSETAYGAGSLLQCGSMNITVKTFDSDGITLHHENPEPKAVPIFLWISD